MRIDLGEYYTVGFIGMQGHPGTTAFVKQFYLKYSPDGLRWSVYGYNPPSQSYKVIPNYDIIRNQCCIKLIAI